MKLPVCLDTATPPPVPLHGRPERPRGERGSISGTILLPSIGSGSRFGA